jgi:hypothetical protein
MLDEDEFRLVMSFRGHWQRRYFREREFGPVLQEYERITGFQEVNPNAVWHHRLSLYGPPCLNCGKPLRTQRARLCAADGFVHYNSTHDRT